MFKRKYFDIYNLLIVTIVFMLITVIYLTFFIQKISAQQPEFGPGGSDYAHLGMSEKCYGSGETAYWLFEPINPKPSHAPVVVFAHGFSATSPRMYKGWIEHIVRKGRIVIYPVYQRTPFSLLQVLEFPTNALIATQLAFEQLLNNLAEHVMPNLDCMFTVGHSMGGTIAADIAARAQEYNLPHVAGILCAEPGRGQTPPVYDLSNLGEDTFLLTVVGDKDFIVGDKTAKNIYYKAENIPIENKDHIILNSDGFTIAGHFAPLCFSSRTANNLDYYGLWKLLDGLIECALHDNFCEYCLGDTVEQRYMGEGFKELTVIDNP